MISVIIPTHNRHLEVVQAINSVLSQSVLPIELIVIDDASYPPLTRDIFNQDIVNINCILERIEISSGGNFARNLGVSIATGDYIAFLDDDDIFEFNKIEIIYKYINDYPKIDLFYHRARINMKVEDYYYTTNPANSLNHISELLLGNVIGGTPMVVVKRLSLIAVGGFDINLPALQDYELWIRFFDNNYNFKYINEVLTTCNYVTCFNSVSKSLDSHRIAVEIIEKRYSNYYSQLSKSEKRIRAYNDYKVIIHKMLLNGMYKRAFIFSINFSIKNFKVMPLFHSVAILIGPRFVSFLKKRGF